MAAAHRLTERAGLVGVTLAEPPQSLLSKGAGSSQISLAARRVALKRASPAGDHFVPPTQPAEEVIGVLVGKDFVGSLTRHAREVVQSLVGSPTLGEGQAALKIGPWCTCCDTEGHSQQ